MSNGLVALDKALGQELARCVRCGTCMKVCPVFGALQREGGVARGKLMLITAQQQGELPAGSEYAYFLSACLLCGRCKSSCPNEVDTPRVVQAARAQLAVEGKSGWFKRFVVRRLLPSRKFLPRLLKGARWSRALWAARIPKESGLQLRFLRGPRGERRRIPPVAKPFFLERDLPDDWAGSGTKVGLFVGCVSNYLRPEAAASAVKVLTRAGASVRVPRDQGCCGLPAFGAGETSVALAQRNLDAFLPAGGDWPDAITTPCASCAWMLGKQLPEMLAQDPLLAERARELARRVVPFSRLWAQLSGVTHEGSGRARRGPGPALTYHDPCHLSRGFGEQDAPRFLLTSLPGAHFVEMEHPCSCCGHGGSFNVSHYGLSSAIARTKVERVLATGAELLVTECSGCVLQLSEALGRVRPGFEVVTTAEASERFSADQVTNRHDRDHRH